MRHLWQWICGYICVGINGRQVSRFLNLCSRNGIHLWRITYDLEHSLQACLRLRDYYDLKPYLRKTKTKIKIISKKGFPFWCHRHPKLKWFFCICFLCICIGCYSLNYVWNIEIKGNIDVSTEDILMCLKDNQVDIGRKKNEIDCSKIEVLLREQFHQISWTSVYLDNTNLCVEVKESLYDEFKHPETENNRMYHLVTDKDAKILSIVTRAGKAVVKEGQFVKKGEHLVLGYSEIFDDSGEIKQTLYLKADAQVYGLVVHEIEIPISEMEVLASNIAHAKEDVFLGIGNRKLNPLIKKIEDSGGILLDKKVFIEINEKKICFRAKLYVREQIGINIPAEEVWENEFE